MVNYMFKKLSIFFFLIFLSTNIFADYKIMIGGEKISIPKQKGLSGQIENGAAYSVNARAKAIFYSHLVDKMIYSTDFYHLGYAHLSWVYLISLDNDETGQTSLLKSFELNHGNDEPGTVSHVTEDATGIYVNTVNSATDDYIRLFKIYPSPSFTKVGGTSNFYPFYNKNNESFTMVSGNLGSNLYYANGSSETTDVTFRYASYNKDSDIMALYGYPYVRAVKSDGTVLWDKHIYNDLNLNQNPSLTIAGNSVLVQYGSVVKKVDSSGNVSDFINFAETGYPSATIKGSYFNPKNNKLYFFSGSNKIGIMK